MTRDEKVSFKNNLKSFCCRLIEERIDSLKASIENAQQAANNEEKSSAGDKYETARAISHLEKDMQARQLAENLKELAILHSVDVNKIYSEVTPGAFVKCTRVSFFIAAGLGKRVVDEQVIFFLSPHAPLAKLLQQKKLGDHFSFNAVEEMILDLY